MSKIWEKIGNPMPVEGVLGPIRNNMKSYGELQHKDKI